MAEKEPEKKEEEKKAPVNLPPAKKVTGSKASNTKSSNKTFAPASPYGDLKEVIKPHKGSVVEVLVAWKDRILSSNHFHEHGSVFMSAAPDASITPADVQAHAKARLAGYKQPKYVVIADALPKNPSGKILKRELRTPYWEGRERNVGCSCRSGRTRRRTGTSSATRSSTSRRTGWTACTSPITSWVTAGPSGRRQRRPWRRPPRSLPSRRRRRGCGSDPSSCR